MQDILVRVGALETSQHGFLAGKSTSDPILATVLVAEDAVRRETPLHTVALDIRRAYDSVEATTGKEMALRRLGLPETVISFFLRLVKATTTTVSTAYGLAAGDAATGDDQWESEGWFQAECGWAQGAEEAPLGWTIFYDGFLSMIRTMPGPGAGYWMAGDATEVTELRAFAFADDTCLFSASKTGLQRLIDVSQLFCSFMGLELAAQK